MDFPALISTRWQLAEFVLLEYRKSLGVLVDVGPFPKDPDDEQTEKAYKYLEESHLDFLALSDQEWALDLGKLSERFPQLKDENLIGQLSHPPAFETTSAFVPKTDRFYNKDIFSQDTHNGVYFLRIRFALSDSPAEPVLNPSLDESIESAAENSVAQEPQSEEALAPEDASPSSKLVEENIFYFYTKFSPEVCKQKLKPYIPRTSDSSAVQSPSHPFDFIVSLNTNSFQVQKVSNDSTRYLGSYSANFKPENDGGTMITGEYGVATVDSLKGFAPYAGILVSFGIALMGWAWTQTPDVPASKMFWGGCLAFAGVLALFGFVGNLQKHNRERQAVYEETKLPLLDFVQKTLEAEIVEREEEVA